MDDQQAKDIRDQPVLTADQLLAEQLDSPVPVVKGQTIGELLDTLADDPITLKRLIDLRAQQNAAAAADALVPAIPDVAGPDQASVIQNYGNDGNATDQWHDYLHAANLALAKWVAGKGLSDKEDAATFWPAYLKALLDLHKSARKVVPSAEVSL